MDWLRENWFWLIVGVGFVWMHLKMHGGHGDHADHQHDHRDPDDDQGPKR